MFDNFALDEANQKIARLEFEKEALAQQVKRLVKTESKLYEYQEQLDSQLREYKDRYELTRKLNGTFEIKKILELCVEYAIYNLQYEKIIIFLNWEDSDSYIVGASGGYYNQQEKEIISELVINRGDPLFSELNKGTEYVLCQACPEDSTLSKYHARLLVDEFLIYPAGPAERPFALVLVGNSRANAEFYRRITDDDVTLLCVGNLAGLLSSAIENNMYHTNMKRALEQERRAEEKYRSIFENAAEGIIQTDIQGHFISCNPAAASILGYDSPGELIENCPDIAQLYVDPQQRIELYRMLRESSEIKNFEVEFYRSDGSKRWVMLSIRPVLNEQLQIEYVDGMIQDITDRKKAEEALRNLNEELEQRVFERTSQLQTTNAELRSVTQQLESAYIELKDAQSRVLQQEKMASIGQLAAGVAHEINNPMGFIISNLNSLRKYTEKIGNFVRMQCSALESFSGNCDEELKNILIEMQRQKKAIKLEFMIDDLGNIITESLEGADRVKKIVQDLKTFSRLDESEFKEADINAGLESTINIIWNELKYKTSLNKDLGNIPLVWCNHGQLNQVFMNILINAAQAIEVRGEITVKTWSDSGKVYVSISDTGSGIPADKINRIFEPFFTTKEVGKGTGLGLSIAYDILKRHNGEIKVESELGKGTAFTIVIPISVGSQAV